MCLTEPHAGTDLGIIKTKAERNEDGTYSITGTKNLLLVVITILLKISFTWYWQNT